ncbi:hypothetical protein E2C01_031728 [Portunus trituberculatus]|uniref:Uncharacterized protein n=1 Tax=Portunus trituberculatus TaxID=210409 RepID=A0A5B7EVH2_PORTR|nr:hypothetical protein [Portunus trituberculatus]
MDEKCKSQRHSAALGPRFVCLVVCRDKHQCPELVRHRLITNLRTPAKPGRGAAPEGQTLPVYHHFHCVLSGAPRLTPAFVITTRDLAEGTLYRTLYQEKQEERTHTVLDCCPGWSRTVNEDTAGGRRNRQQKRNGNGADEGCRFRSTSTPENGSIEITREGKVFRLVDSTQERHNASDPGGQQEGTGTEDQPPISHPHDLHNSSEEFHRALLSKKKEPTRSVVSPALSDHFPSTKEDKGDSPVNISKPRRFRHQRNSKANTRRHRRRHYHDGTKGSIGRRNHHHHRRQRLRALTSRDADVQAETIYENGSNNNRYHYSSSNDNETEYDAYSYTIILTGENEGERGAGGEGQRPSEELTQVLHPKKTEKEGVVSTSYASATLRLIQLSIHE